jgi:MoaA/NifB/PqqE/SkfB family radical SAM enzyme
MNKIIALRALTSEHHATHIVPSIFTITWNLGKRCNYDCSYCNPTVHDWTSPHLSLDTIKSFLSKAYVWAEQEQKTIKWTFTGGEPYLHPDILEILSTTANSPQCDMVTVTSNGSLPLDLFQQSLESVTNLTVSLHFDRDKEEIEKTVDKVIALSNNNPNKFITVQVMMYPGKFDFIKTITDKLTANSVKHVYRRIRPFKSELRQDLYGDKTNRETNKTRVDAVEHRRQKIKIKSYNDTNLLTIYENNEYYTDDEITWLAENIPEVRWNNVGVWDDKEIYSEANSDELVSKNLHQFKNWTCYIGVDGAYIESTGEIFRGVCTNGGAIGTLDNFTGFSTEPTVCNYNLCLSNPDQTTRKASLGNEKFIT